MPKDTRRTHKTFNKTIGTNLKNFRKVNQLSLQDVGAFLGITYQQVQKYEQGMNRIPVENLYKLGQFYNTPLESFFQDTDPTYPPSRATDMNIYLQLKKTRNSFLKQQIEKIIFILLEEKTVA